VQSRQVLRRRAGLVQLAARAGVLRQHPEAAPRPRGHPLGDMSLGRRGRVVSELRRRLGTAAGAPPPRRCRRRTMLAALPPCTAWPAEPP
jgi:hypothetical protein